MLQSFHSCLNDDDDKIFFVFSIDKNKLDCRQWSCADEEVSKHRLPTQKISIKIRFEWHKNLGF